MIYLIYEKLGSVYWKEGDEIHFAPMSTDGTFNTEDGGVVETWEECAEDEPIVKKFLGMKE